MEKESNRTPDGVLALPGGVDSSRSPYVIEPDTAAWGENVTFRGDYPKQRPGWTRRAVLSPTVANGYYQGATFYRADNGVNQIVLSVGGRDYAITPNLNFLIQEITIPGDLNSSILKFAYYVQAENYLVKNDGQAPPFIYNGVSSRRAVAGEIKTGTVAAYSGGRIWYAVAKGTAFRAGDLVRSSSGTQATGYRDAVLKETENNLLNGGGDFSIPNSAGKISAMAIPAILDTSLGQGPLQVFTDLGSFSVNAPTDRTQWQNLTDPIQTVSSQGAGSVGHRAITLVNGDVFFRGLDGIRSFFVARRDYAQTWANTPISDEIKRVLDADNVFQLSSESTVLFKNRLLNTVWGRTSSFGTYHLGLVALDFDPVSSMRNKQAPRWEGIWTGLKILQIVVGIFNGLERCFAITFNSSYQSQLELWELNEEAIFDSETVRIPCAIESSGLFRDSPFSKKSLETARIFVSGLVGTVDFDMKYRPDQWPCWVDWHSWSECAAEDDCSENECMTGEAAQLQYRPRMGLPQPRDDCNESAGLPMRLFYQMQYRLSWAGPCTINQTRIDTVNKLDPPYGGCPTTQACQALTCCVPDPVSYEL